MLWSLFITFFIIGAVSFGGGYAMLPIIEYEVQKNEWLMPQQFADILAVAGMSPGPIATNSAILIGMETGGLSGAIIAVLAITLPSILLLLVISLFFYKLQQHPFLHSVMYGLRPVIAAMICYAGVRFSIHSGIIGGSELLDGTSLLLTAGSLALLVFTKLHPLLVIAVSGVLGVWLYN